MSKSAGRANGKLTLSGCDRGSRPAPPERGFARDFNPLRIHSAGGVARSDSGRIASGWSCRESTKPHFKLWYKGIFIQEESQ